MNKSPIELITMPMQLDEIITNETNTYVAKMGYDIKFNQEEMVEMLQLYKNEPYKFEELNLYTPYWDNKEKLWCYFTTLNKHIGTGVKVLINDIPMMCAFKFKPNRFYPREVKEDE